jgi:hypothetical protein
VPTCIDEVMVFADLHDCTTTCCSGVCSSNNAGVDLLGVGVDTQGFQCVRYIKSVGDTVKVGARY